jgi:exosome complex component RRP41
VKQQAHPRNLSQRSWSRLTYCRYNHKQSEYTPVFAMPLDTSTYILAHLRLDGRRWNELRRLQAQMSTQAAADGSSYFEMGNTKIICTVAGPQEKKGGGGGGRSQQDKASIEVEVNFAGFSGMDRKKRARSDKYVLVCTNVANG